MAVKLKTGTASQVFYAWVRKTAGAPNPAETMYLYENGASVATVLSNVAITSTSGQLLIGTWDAALLSDSTGAGVECRLVSTGNATNTVEVGAVGWLANYSIDETTTLNLAASNLAGQQPVPGQPAVGQGHALAASALSAQPALAQPSIGQVHALAAASLSAQPALAHPALGQKHALAATSLADQQPLLAQPVMVVRRNLVASGLLDLAPLAGQPAAGQKHVLAATVLADRQPTLGQPILASAGQFTPLPLVDQQPLLGAPAVGQEHILAATNLADRAPLLAAPVVGQVHALAAAALAAAPPALAFPIIRQNHALSATALANGTPVLGQPTVAQVHHLAGANLTSAPVLDHASLTIGIFGLAANDLGARPAALDQASVGQEHALAAADQDAAQAALDAPEIESFLPGVFVGTSLDAAAAILGSPKVNWRELGVIRFRAANTQAKVDTAGARPAYASAGAGISSAVQFGALAPLAPAVQPGDLLLWVAAEFDSDHELANVAPPTGYAQMTSSPFGASTSSYAPRLHVALKRADGSEAGNQQGFNYSLSSGDAVNRSISARVFRITAIDGFAASGVEGIAVSEGVTSGNAAIAAPPVAPAGVNRLGLIVTVVASAAGDTSSAGGIWQQAVPEYQSTMGGDCTIDLQWAALAREPGTGAQIPYGATGAAWVSAGFALAPPRTSIDVASAGVIIEDLPPVLAKAVNM